MAVRRSAAPAAMIHLFCHCEKYCFKDIGDLSRFYFCGDPLYAMQTKKDARDVLYVSIFSEKPRKFIDDSVQK